MKQNALYGANTPGYCPFGIGRSWITRSLWINPTPPYAYVSQGKPAIDTVPRNYRVSLALASWSVQVMDEAMVLDGSADAALEMDIEQHLVPCLLAQFLSD